MKLVNIVLMMVVPMVLRYYPFKDRLRFRVPQLIGIIGIVWLLATSMILGLQRQIPALGAYDYVTVYKGIMPNIFLLLSCFMIKERFSKHFFVYLMVMNIISMYMGIAYFTEAHLGGGYLVINLTLVLLVLLTMPPMLLFYRRALIPVMDVGDSGIWKLIWIGPLLLFTNMLFSTVGTEGAWEYSYIIQRLIVGLGSIFTCVSLIVCLQHARRQALREEELSRVREVSDMKTEFLRGVTHELKTPLAVISGCAQDTAAILDDDPVSTADIRYNQDSIVGEAERLSHIVNQLLDAASFEQGRIEVRCEELMLPELIGEVADTYQTLLQQNHNQLKLNIAAGMSPLRGDSESIKQVLINLLSNANRHTSGGVITVSLRQSNTFQELAVADTGEGIPPEIRKRLFRDQLSNPGVFGGRGGLGLFISKKIVAAHSGEIEVESEVGKGTVVTVRLPLDRRVER